MKNYFFLAVVFAFLFFGCSDSSSDVPSSTLTMFMNNSKWSGDAGAYHDIAGGDTIDIQAQKNFQYVQLRFKLTGKGVSALDPNATVFVTTVGGDVIDKMYVLALPGSVTVTKYTPGLSVEGTFSLVVKQVGTNDEIPILNGKFNAKIH